MRPPAPAQPEGEPARSPIELRDLNPEQAKISLHPAISLAAEVFPGTDRFDTTKMVEAMIDIVVERDETGKPEQICLKEVAERAKIGRGRIGDRFGDDLALFANLVVRGVHGKAGRRVYYEELSAHAAKVGRRNNGFGTDKFPGMPNYLNLLDHSLGSSDRHCPVGCEPLGLGTRWDPESEHFGTPLPRWASSYEGKLPTSFVDHVEKMLGVDMAVRRALGAAAERPLRFPGELSREQLRGAFSAFLVVPLIRCGTLPFAYRDYGKIYYPGRDPSLVAWAQRSGRRVLLACGDPDAEERERFEARSEPLRVGKLPSMYELGIRREHAVDYRWSPQAHELGRYTVGRGAKLEIWHLSGAFKPDGAAIPKVFWKMLSIIERLAQVDWTARCTERWENDCQPGMLKAHLPESCAGVRALLAMANAGMVDALRRTASDQEFERGE